MSWHIPPNSGGSVVRTFFAIACALGLSIASPAFISPGLAKSIHKEFVESWEAREAQYSGEREALDPRVRASVALLIEAMGTEGADLGPHLISVRDGIEAVAYLDGRGKTIHNLRLHMGDKPSAAASELWMQEQTATLQRDARSVDSLMAAVHDAPAGSALGAMLSDFEKAVTLAGQVRGRMDELNLIDANLGSYYQGRSRQDAERRRARAAILGAIGASLQQSAMQQQAALRARWNASCSNYGNRTTCTGN